MSLLPPTTAATNTEINTNTGLLNTALNNKHDEVFNHLHNHLLPLHLLRPRPNSLRLRCFSRSNLWRKQPSPSFSRFLFIPLPFFYLPLSSLSPRPFFSNSENSQVPCISSAASAAGCTSGDYGCRCSNSGPIQTSAQACVISNCGIATALQVQASASAVCACVATATAA